MIRLADIVNQYGDDFVHQFKGKLLPSHLKALSAFKVCRSVHSPKILLSCEQCNTTILTPHSCGHRSCPHCQNFESQRWIEAQLAKQVPADYFLLTFTLPAQLRDLAWHHQRQVFSLLFQCVWQTINTFTANDKHLGGTAGAVAVLHTHSRRLDFHPHVHVVMPSGSIDKKTRGWKSKSGHYLFSHKALAKVFRAKFIVACKENGLPVVGNPLQWVVDCSHVGKGDKAIVYLGRYLYRGVIQEKDIVSCSNNLVTFCFVNSKTKRQDTKTVSVFKFLWLVIQHVLPRGFRRARNFGYLHPNSKKLILALQWHFRLHTNQVVSLATKRKAFLCTCCKTAMHIVKTRIDHRIMRVTLVPT